MGKKINPKVLRLGTTTSHMSKWFVSKQQFPVYLKQDVQLRRMLRKKLRDGGVARVEIKRSSDRVIVVIYTSKPGVIIGRSGSGIEELKKIIKKQFFGSTKVKINIEVEEVRRPDIDAELVMQGIINQLEKRIPFRRAMKRAIESSQNGGAKGVKVICSGRLNGVEIARREMLAAGSIPTQTLRADIDYARGAAHTIYGQIGVKVWIYRGQIFEKPVVEIKSTRPTTERSSRPKLAATPAITDATTKKSAFKQKRTIVKSAATKRPTSNPANSTN